MVEAIELIYRILDHANHANHANHDYNTTPEEKQLLNNTLQRVERKWDVLKLRRSECENILQIAGNLEGKITFILLVL